MGHGRIESWQRVRGARDNRIGTTKHFEVNHDPRRADTLVCNSELAINKSEGAHSASFGRTQFTATATRNTSAVAKSMLKPNLN